VSRLSDLQKVMRWMACGSHRAEVIVWCILALGLLYVLAVLMERMFCGD
jgi:hypothetical protein